MSNITREELAEILTDAKQMWRSIGGPMSAGAAGQSMDALEYFAGPEMMGAARGLRPQSESAPERVTGNASPDKHDLARDANMTKEELRRFLGDKGDTPRTDAMQAEAGFLAPRTGSEIAWKFARELERELAEAKAKLHAWAVEMNITGVMDGADNPQHAIARLREKLTESAERDTTRKLMMTCPQCGWRAGVPEGWINPDNVAPPEPRCKRCGSFCTTCIPSAGGDVSRPEGTVYGSRLALRGAMRLRAGIALRAYRERGMGGENFLDIVTDALVSAVRDNANAKLPEEADGT